MLNRCLSKYLSVIIFLFWTSSHPINASSSDGSNNFLGSNSKELGELSIDIDGDGKVDALTDGLLLLRYMFGLSGSSRVLETLPIQPFESEKSTRNPPDTTLRK